MSLHHQTIVEGHLGPTIPLKLMTRENRFELEPNKASCLGRSTQTQPHVWVGRPKHGLMYGTLNKTNTSCLGPYTQSNESFLGHSNHGILHAIENIKCKSIKKKQHP